MKNLIILIDDDAATNLIHERLIRRLGKECDLKIFESGKLAIEFYQGESFESNEYKNILIFLDYFLPGFDGLELLDEIYEEADETLTDKTKVHFLTNNMTVRLDEKSSLYEMVKGVIRKPLKEEVLMEILDHLN